MKKKLLYAVLSVSMVVSLMGCKNQNTNNTEKIATDTDTNIATETDTKDTTEEKADNTNDDKDKTKDTTTENTTETTTEDTTEIKAEATGENLGELEKKPENTTQTTKPNNNTQTKPSNTTQENTTENTTTQATTTETPKPATTEAATEGGSIDAASTEKQPKLVWHDPVYKTVTEKVPVYKEYEIMETVYCEQCNSCKQLLYGQAEVDAHFSNGHGGGYRSYEYQRGTGEYETCVAYYDYVEKEVLVQEGYWEEVYE